MPREFVKSSDFKDENGYYLQLNEVKGVKSFVKNRKEFYNMLDYNFSKNAPFQISPSEEERKLVYELMGMMESGHPKKKLQDGSFRVIHVLKTWHKSKQPKGNSQ